MDAAEVVHAFGGIATRRQLLAHLCRGDLDRAVTAGTVVRASRDRYALPSTDAAVACAHALSGALCLTSAALHHGWAVKNPPERPHVAVDRSRKLTPEQRRQAVVHRHRLHPDDIVDAVATTKDPRLDRPAFLLGGRDVRRRSGPRRDGGGGRACAPTYQSRVSAPS